MSLGSRAGESAAIVAVGEKEDSKLQAVICQFETADLSTAEVVTSDLVDIRRHGPVPHAYRESCPEEALAR